MKHPKMPITKTPDGFRFSIPARYSPTGKRHRRFFRDSATAENERDVTLARIRDYGLNALKIPPDVAVDATRAADLLKPYQKTLTELAMDWIEQQERKKASITVDEVLHRNLQIKAGNMVDPSNKGKWRPRSDATIQNIKRFGGKFSDRLGKMNVTDLTPHKVVEAMAKDFPTPTGFNTALSYLKPAFALALKNQWIPSNPFENVTHRKDHAKREIDFLSVEDVQKLMASIRDHRGNQNVPEYLQCDTRPALAAFCLMLWAGIRPKEMERIRWSDVRFDHGVVRIPATTSKTGTLRNVEMSANLVEWLSAVTKKERTGSITPSNWGRIYKCVRFVSGLNKRQGDVMRHTYATMYLSAGGSMDEALANMGHTTPRTTLRHYATAADKDQAVRFWTITPEGRKTRLKAV